MDAVKFKFVGGPLDGEVKREHIPSKWQILRFEHRPDGEPFVRYVYRGYRESLDSPEIPMHFVEAISEVTCRE